MAFPTLDLLLPVMLALHNLDEYRHHDGFAGVHPGAIAKRFTSRQNIRDAMLLLTFCAALLALAVFIIPGSTLIAAASVATFALAFNALGHVVLSIRRSRLLPGTHSAVFLVLPYTTVAIADMRLGLHLPWSALLTLAALGAVSLPFVIGFFLLVTHAFTQLRNLRAPAG